MGHCFPFDTGPAFSFQASTTALVYWRSQFMNISIWFIVVVAFGLAAVAAHVFMILVGEDDDDV